MLCLYANRNQIQIEEIQIHMQTMQIAPMLLFCMNTNTGSLNCILLKLVRLIYFAFMKIEKQYTDTNTTIQFQLQAQIQ